MINIEQEAMDLAELLGIEERRFDLVRWGESIQERVGERLLKHLRHGLECPVTHETTLFRAQCRCDLRKLLKSIFKGEKQG